jgi:hypothetical protein
MQMNKNREFEGNPVFDTHMYYFHLPHQKVFENLECDPPHLV